MSSPPSETPPPTSQTRPDRGLREFGEDTTGFGEMELRTLWHTLRRPAVVLDAYMTAGPTGGGLYTRPLRLYLALCGILMVMLFLMGGTSAILSSLPPEALTPLTPLIERSGKSHEAFMSDFDGWTALVLVPINAVFYALFSAPLLRWWDAENIGWRKGFRATFHYLNAWTIPFMPIAWLAYLPGSAGAANVIMVALSAVAFLRTGKGRWYRSRLSGVVKATVIIVVGYLAAVVANVPVMAIGLAGGLFG